MQVLVKIWENSKVFNVQCQLQNSLCSKIRSHQYECLIGRKLIYSIQFYQGIGTAWFYTESIDTLVRKIIKII